MSGHLQLFTVDDGVLKHTWEQTAGMWDWAGWDIKGYPGPGRLHPAQPLVSVAAHQDGRLEVFGRATWDDDDHLAHCWANARDAWG